MALTIPSGLAGAHQVQNASLAVELAKRYLLATGTTTIDQELETRLSAGLAEAKWPGRCQTVADPSYPSTSWHLDGAHTVESLECCMSWYMSPDVGLTTNAQLSVLLHISSWFLSQRGLTDAMENVC
jgi:folylpolyglutamate synthase